MENKNLMSLIRRGPEGLNEIVLDGIHGKITLSYSDRDIIAEFEMKIRHGDRIRVLRVSRDAYEIIRGGIEEEIAQELIEGFKQLRIYESLFAELRR